MIDISVCMQYKPPPPDACEVQKRAIQTSVCYVYVFPSYMQIGSWEY